MGSVFYIPRKSRSFALLEKCRTFLKMYNRFPEDTAKELTNDIIRAGMEEKGIGEFADEIVGKREPEPETAAAQDRGGRKPGLARGGAGFRPVVVFKDERGGQFIRKQVQGAGIVSVFGHALPAMGG